MIKKSISFVVLFLTLLNIPTIVLETRSISISSPISYLLFSLLTLLIITFKFNYSKTIITLGITASLYFLISALQYDGDYLRLILVYLKFILYLFGLYIALRNIDQRIIIVFLFLGAVTILLDSLYFRFNDVQGVGYVSQYGRYAGFYLNPNTAAMICLLGYALTITRIHIWKFLSIGFTLFGFLTLSRTFMATWFVLTVIYLFHHRKYVVKTSLLIIVSIFSLIKFSKELNLDTVRFEFFVNLFSGQINKEVLKDDSRQDQWAKFYDRIMDSPIIGNGFQTFSSSLIDKNSQGVHNSFLLILGESGFIPFLLIIFVFFILFKKCYNLRKKNLTLLLLIVVIFMQFLVSHNFFDSGLMLFIFLNVIYLLNFNYDKRII